MTNDLTKMERRAWSDLLSQRLSFLLGAEYEVFLTPDGRIAVANRIDVHDWKLKGIVMDWQGYDLKKLLLFTEFVFGAPQTSATWDNTAEGMKIIFGVK